MITKRYGGLTLITLACAAGTYLATYALQQQTRPPAAQAQSATRQATIIEQRSVTANLGLTSDQLAATRDIESRFAADRATLETQLATERSKLAGLLEDPNTPGDQLVRQIDAVIAAQGALERRIASYLVELRPTLTAAQQKRLFERFATGVREGGGWRWRHGQAAYVGGGRRGGGPPNDRGGGPPADRGPGRGRGRGGPWR